MMTIEATTLPEYFETLSEDEIRSYCGSKIFYRGEEYYRGGAVKDARFNPGKTAISAIVTGSKKYNVTIGLKQGNLTAGCSCPYGGVCKHGAALLLYALENADNLEADETEEKEQTNNFDIKKYLYTLSKDELVKLTLNHVPENYYIEIKNRHSGSSDANKKFKKAERAVNALFEDDDLLYDPAAFEEALDGEIEKLKGLEPLLKNEIGEFILYLINKIDRLFDDGYLYTDNSYSGDDYFTCSQELEDFVTRYLQSLNFTERTAFLATLDSVLGSASYDTFSDLRKLQEKTFNAADIPALKEMVMKDYPSLPSTLLENYYKKLKEHFSAEEKEKILIAIKDFREEWLLELAELYKIRGRIQEGILLIKERLRRHPDGYIEKEVFEYYLDFLNAEGQNLSEAAKSAIACCPQSGMMKKIASLLSESSSYEAILEKGNPAQLLEYLENSERLDEAVALINRNKGIWSDDVYAFYKRHKKKFPERARAHFSDVIDKNLLSTGESHYHAIADAIREIRQVDPEYATALVGNIKANYSRRRSLMAILSKI